MAQMLKITFLLLGCFYLAARAQIDDECDGVDEGLAGILQQCRQGTEACLASQDLSGLGGLFCTLDAQVNFETFRRCTNVTYSDQIFSILCSGPECYRPDPCTDTCISRVASNTGEAAFDACCAGNSFASTIESCAVDANNTCADALQDLVDDLECCVNSSPYAYYFSTCQASLALDAIEELYEACNVTLPDSCQHTFSDVPTDATTAGTSAVLSIKLVVGLAVTLALSISIII